MGWEVSFLLLYVGGGRRGHLIRGGWSHSPPVGKGGDVDDNVLCGGGGYGCMGGVFAIIGFLMTS